MNIFKIPRMSKEEYDHLIYDNYVCHIAFKGDDFPYVIPFIYSFDGKYLYFLPTRYGRKIDYFHQNPNVSVEIESYASDFSSYKFISLQGTLEEIKDDSEKQQVRSSFVNLIKDKELSSNVLAALGYEVSDSPEIILQGNRNMVWRLVNVKEIVALKDN